MNATTKKIAKNKKAEKIGSVLKTKKTPKKRMSLLDYAKKLEKKPLFKITKEDEDLIFGSNMMVKLMQE